MASVNRAILVGNLGADPEMRYLQSGDAVANLRLATTDRYKDKQSGEMKEATEWHRVTFYGKLAEIVGQYLRKGSQIYVEGSIRTKKWQDKDGNDRYSTEIRGEAMQMLGGRQSGGDDGGQQRPPAQHGNARGAGQQSAGSGGGRQMRGGGGNGFEDMDDDIPFAGIDSRLPL